MLSALSIINFTIVEQLDLDFNQGMSVFTGETGAGKSIMLDALSLVLGSKTDLSLIREGSQQCDISASFTISTNPDVTSWLKEQDLTIDSELILRRVLTTNGRSKSYIAGQVFPLQKVRELGELLVNIHGQHQQQHLLKPDNHREQLDAFAGLELQAEKVKAHFHLMQKIANEIKQLKALDNQKDRRDLLVYQVQELESLQLQEGEVEKLNQQHLRLSQAQDLIENSKWCLQQLSNESDETIESQLNQLLQSLEKLPDEETTVKNAKELIQSALINCEEAASEVHQFFQSLAIDPEQLQTIEQRLDKIHDIARKHQIKASQLYLFHTDLQNELAQLDAANEKITLLEKEHEKAKNVYRQEAMKLSDARKKNAATLSKKITQSIKQLGMPNGKVDIILTPLDEEKATGLEKIEYFVAANPGQRAQLLAKIASGGELSRISLAIQVLTAEKKAYPTLIFDEVDVGIGGATAAIVGNLLRRLGEHTQVFCITHQAQVAANAHHHFHVEKTTRKDKTFSTIKPLTDDKKIDELARMLGGVTITDQTKAHAKELLAQVEL